MKNLQLLFAAAMMLLSCTAAKPALTIPCVSIKEIVKNSETTLIDVRVPEQFAEKTAENAVNIPLATMQDSIGFFKKQKNIVVFCNTGKQASEAMDLLKKNGVENVYYGKTLKNVEAIQKEKVQE